MRIPELGRTAGRLSPLALAFLVVALLLGTTGGAVAGALITGAQIKNGTITGVDIKNGSVAGADIKNRSVTASDLVDEPRAWGASKTSPTDDFTSATYTSVLTKSLTTAKAGYLTITGTIYAEDDITLDPVGRLYFTLRIDGKLLGGSRLLSYNGSGDGENGTVNVVVPVSKGTHSVSLVALEGGGGSFIASAGLSAVYTPIGNSSGLVLTRNVPQRTTNR